MPQCGACCFLGDFDEDVIADMLKKECDIVEYLEMIGSDGWCRHFDKESKGCSIYSSRPRFCRVELDVFRDLYGAKNEDDMNSVAIDCCEHHIASIYPTLNDKSESEEMTRFQRLVSDK